jgi:holo-[acyl-carrier protein] synthase
MILGTGIDFCEVGRMRKSLDSAHGERLKLRVFTAGEIAYAESKANRYERFAARFAAKEAGMKALGTGWAGGVSWHDLEVVNLPSGRPTLEFHGKARELAVEMGVRQVWLTMSHAGDGAVGMVVLEG